MIPTNINIVSREAYLYITQTATKKDKKTVLFSYSNYMLFVETNFCFGKDSEVV